LFTAKQVVATIAAFKEETNALFIAAPVVFETDHSMLQIFQALDFLTTTGNYRASVYRHSLYVQWSHLAYDKSVL